jgi:hypothetical protein
VFKCDFCGKQTDRVRRIALDKDYDRLGERHAVRYACAECSRRKENERVERSAALDASEKPL